MLAVEIVSDFDGVSFWQLKDDDKVIAHGILQPTYSEAYHTLQLLACSLATLLGLEVPQDARVPLKTRVMTNGKAGETVGRS